jgi:hypothetical protein
MTWKIVPSYPLYEARDDGQIRRRATGRYYHAAGKIKKQSMNSNGYLRVTLDGDHVLVNRMVCEAFNGPAPTDKHHAAHRDGNRANNSNDNLRWLTKKENEAEKILHGTSNAGQKNGMSFTSRMLRGEL